MKNDTDNNYKRRKEYKKFSLMNETVNLAQFTTKELLNLYKKSAVPLLEVAEDNTMVSEERQAAKFNSLKAALEGEGFFFVVNLHTMELENIYGVEKLLGYSHHNFDFYRYLDIIHPSHIYPNTEASKATLEGLYKGEIPLHFYTHRYNSEIALRKYNGNYIFCKRTACVFQFNKKNQLTAYINIFTVISTEYTGQPFSVSCASDEGESATILNDFLELSKCNFEKLRYFTEREMDVIEQYAYSEENRVPVNEIAKRLGVEKSTVIEYNKRIISKAEIPFRKKFSSAYEVALQLKKAKLI